MDDGGLIRAVGQALMAPHPYIDGSDSPSYLAGYITGLFGSGRAAARYLGVSESTLRGWRRGRQPRIGQQAVLALARRAATYRSDGAYWRAWQGGPGGELTIRGVVVVSGDVRLRTVHPGRYIPRARMREVLTTWQDGDDARAEALLYSYMDQYYVPMEFDSIDSVTIE